MGSETMEPLQERDDQQLQEWNPPTERPAAAVCPSPATRAATEV